MVSVLIRLTLSGLVLTQVTANAQARVMTESSAPTSIGGSADPTDIPPAPSGKSTIFGGKIRDLDLVRDQLTLNVYGQRPMKILFDERTEVYRDGARVHLRDLHPEEQASIQTALDGAKQFAVSIHMLSNPDSGEYEGRVLRFDPGTGELILASGQSREKIKLLVQNGTSIVRKGQEVLSSEHSGPSDLVTGSLVAVKFRATSGKGDAVASEVAVLAIPGATFVFSGSLSFLDLRSGSLELIDQRDDKNYQVSFDPGSLRTAENLHLGDKVKVIAKYDGIHYVASDITVN